MFNANSIVVKTWFTAFLAGVYKYKDVPNLSNLRVVVKDKLEQIGYDTENEGA